MLNSYEQYRKYYKRENFFNRDLSWLEFNRRVLDEALNPKLPLLDRVKFLSIFSSNLDEFYMIRVSGLKEQIRANIFEKTIDGLTPIEAIKLIEQSVAPMLEKISHYWRNTIIPELKENNINLCSYEDLEKNERKLLNEYFEKEIFPVLTPLAFDPGRPFPYISNLSLSLAVFIKRPNKEKHFARVKVPVILPRLLNIDALINKNNQSKETGKKKYIWLETLIRNNLNILFPGVEVLESYCFRITRDTDLEIQEDEADDLLELIEENVKLRKFGSVVRLEVEENIPVFMLETLIENLQITREDIHVIKSPLGLSSVMELYNIPFGNLKEKPFLPVIPKVFEENESVFSIISKNDIIIHQPFQSFSPVIDFIRSASRDPEVLAIKQTLYRVGPNSPVVRALIEAAERKKQVAVLVELKARFDEENNIYWAKELEKAGVHVVYGLLGLKTHSKMTLVVRKEPEGVKRYVHLSTGNYNATTAKIYTDISYFTDDNAICSDVSEIFNFLTGYSEQRTFRTLAVAPINMRDTFLNLINQEISNIKKGKKGYIIFKLNSLVDPVLIAALYEASCAGVKIDLIVRGICCLIPQIKGLSENITVRSIVGRFLEHSRVYYFYNSSKEIMYVSSADLMPRNLDRRVEVAYPINDKKLKKNIFENILLLNLKDNVKSKILLPDGKYYPIKTSDNEEKISSQEKLMELASANIL